MDRVATNHDHCNGQQSSSSRDERDDESTAEVVADLSRQSIDLNICTTDVVPGRGLYTLYQSGKYTDVTFKIDKHCFKAHRVIVASQSAFFDRLLYGDMRESSCDEINLHDTPPEAFRIILEYMYSGMVGKVDLQTALELLALSDAYDFQELKSKLEEVLSSITDFSNVLQFYFYADLYSANRLQQGCGNFIDNNAQAILKGDTILELPQDSFRQLISRDSFVVEELEVFHAIQRWMKYNKIERRDIHDLLWCVRLSEIPKDELLSKVKPTGLYDSRSISKAVDVQTVVERKNVTTRGRVAGFNLCHQDSTELVETCNFHRQIHPDRVFGEFCPPCCYTFNLILRASEAGYSAITFKFDDLYLINELQIHAESGGQRCEVKEPFSYLVEVSKDGERWVCVINHSRCKCYSLQQLYFPKQAARYVRYIQTRGYEGCSIKFSSCSTVVPDPPFTFSEDSLMVPLTLISPVTIQHVTFIPDVGLRFFVIFHQPYCISMVRFHLSGYSGLGDLDVAVSLINKARSYKAIALLHNHNFRDELICSFSRQPVSIVSITLTALHEELTAGVNEEETSEHVGLCKEMCDQISVIEFGIISSLD